MYMIWIIQLLPCFPLKVGDALATAGEHKKALEQAERIEQEFISLMTGQKQGKQRTPPCEGKHYEVHDITLEEIFQS